MNTHADKTQEKKSLSVANADSQKQTNGESTFQFVDNQPEAIQMRNLQELANNHAQKNTFQFVDNRPETVVKGKLREVINNSPQAKQAAQLQAMAENHSTKQQQPIQKKASPEPSRRGNTTGRPQQLKSGIENLTGSSTENGTVPYNSDLTTQLNDLAYAQGSAIHGRPGKGQHTPPQVWHVVQQAQGRVQPPMQLKDSVPVHDEAVLEQEADVMGAKAIAPTTLNARGPAADEVVQGKFALEAQDQRELADKVNHSPEVFELQPSVRDVQGSTRVVAPASQPHGLFGAAQRSLDPGGVSSQGQQVIQATKIHADFLDADIKKAQKREGGADKLTVLAVLRKIASDFKSDVSTEADVTGTFKLLEKEGVMDIDDLYYIAVIVKEIMINEGKEPWKGEKDRLINLMPPVLYEGKSKFWYKGKWKQEVETFFKDTDLKTIKGDNWALDQEPIADFITAGQQQRAADWMTHVWERVGEMKPMGKAPTKAEFWKFLGWEIKGKEWTLRQEGVGPSACPLHLTVSADSILAPSTVINLRDPNALRMDPAMIYSWMFEIPDIHKRVHVSRETPQRNQHIYIGGTNGNGVAIPDGEWDGDAQVMKAHLNTFRESVIEKMIEAKLKGWNLSP